MDKTKFKNKALETDNTEAIKEAITKGVLLKPIMRNGEMVEVGTKLTFDPEHIYELIERGIIKVSE